jgi:hypothetical protein
MQSRIHIFATIIGRALLERDPEKWIPVFRKDHAPPKIQSAMTIQPKAIAL